MSRVLHVFPATTPPLPTHLASFYSYCLHSSKHHDLLKQITEAADHSDRFDAFHKDRLAWVKENLSQLLAEIGIEHDKLEQLNPAATNLFLECRDLLERTSDWVDKGKITDAVSLLVKACFTSSPTRPSIESSTEVQPPAHLQDWFLFLTKANLTVSKQSKAAYDEARKKWVSEEFIPWVASDSKTQKQLKDLHNRGNELTSTVFSEYEAAKPPSHSHFQELLKFKFKITFRKSQPSPALRALPDEAKLSSAFHQDFLDPHGYIPRLRKDLEESADGWHTNSYYYPDKDGLRVVYCSFMQPGSTGYPKRSKIADKLVLCQDESEFKYYFAACFEAVMEDRNTPQKILERQTNHATQEAFWTGIENRMEKLKKLSVDAFDQHALFAEGDGNQLEVVFVFDEARSLLENPHSQSESGAKSPFYYMRQAAQSFANKSQAFVISMDTKARMPEVAPVNRVDAAERLSVAGEDQKRNFRPLFLFGSVDIGLLSSYGLKDTDAFSPRKYLSHGRILWRALMDANFTVRKVRELAVSKLAGGGRVSFDPTPNITAPMAASFIRARVPYLVYQSELASELIASNMWWCMSISDERDHIVAGMPSEPILADAAALWMHNAENRLEILKLFSYLSSRSAIDIGHGGEIVAQLLLILGRDTAVWKSSKNLSNVSI
ncbi:hypothetical protein DFJ73DRAFT_830066 [Zopfochytrium polystomum]|nr:hypothetical protein DFJ73DRAFT_830066 [Zopfochytrium polystomum]